MKIGLNILLIEDDENDAVRIGHELTSAGLIFGVRRVETEREFLSALRQDPPDVILSDHGLPSFDGFTALRLAQDEAPQIPFIFVSGTFDLPTIVEMIENGAAGYVYKNRISELVPAIEDAIESAAEEGRHRQAEMEETVVREEPTAPAPPKPRETTTEVCSKCKRIRTPEGQWEPLDVYLRRHGEARIALALCPDCLIASGRWRR